MVFQIIRKISASPFLPGEKKMKSLLGKTFPPVTILKKAKTIGEAFSATLSSNVFSRSRLASNQCLMNQIGNLVTLPGRGIKSGLNQEYHEKHIIGPTHSS